jgi:hypothetical protein
MRRELMLAILILLGGAAGAARADFVAAPNFSAEERETIARVQVLRDMVQGDPWLVRLAFDLAAQSNFPPRPSEPTTQQPNADLPSTRDAQSIVNWNDLLRKAKERKKQRGWNDGADSARSAIGIVDTNDLMRQAKAKKEGRTAQ